MGVKYKYTSESINSMTGGNTVAKVLCNAYEPSVRNLLGMQIERMGYRPILVSSTAEAIPNVSDADLVITDITRGCEKVYDYVRANKPDIKVIFMDGGGRYADGAPAGAAVISKPFTFGQLETIVNGNVSQHLKPVKTQ